MEYPQGMSDIRRDDCIILNKCIYGLVQAVRQYYKKVIKIFKNSGFKGGTVDPYLFIKKSAKSIVYVALYIDDNIMEGDVKATDDMIVAHKENGLVLRIMEGLHDYLFCKIKFSTDKVLVRTAPAHQKFEKKFGKQVKDVRSHKTLGTPKFFIIRPMVESKKISAEGQQEYWLVVGMLLYLMKHVHPDLSNTTRQLLSANIGANSSAFNERLHVIKWLKIESTKRDSNYAGDLVS